MLNKSPVRESQLLSHELQLDESLNTSIHQARRADFSLLLAMLTDDVSAHSQFQLPKTVDDEITVDDAKLRRLFDLPHPQALALNELKDIDQFNQAEQIASGLMTAIKLNDALTPKPLSFRNDKTHIDSNVMANTSIHCQYRAETGAQQTERQPMNANEWLKAIHDGLVSNQVAQNTPLVA
ncbi:VC2046/SO_2500 family protein [Colwellia sp. MEBiC06753]